MRIFLPFLSDGYIHAGDSFPVALPGGALQLNSDDPLGVSLCEEINGIHLTAFQGQTILGQPYVPVGSGDFTHVYVGALVSLDGVFAYVKDGAGRCVNVLIPSVEIGYVFEPRVFVCQFQFIIFFTAATHAS